MAAEFEAIRERLAKCPIPEQARADWDGTNHYEVHDPSDDAESWWWFAFAEEFDSDSEMGKRLGVILDYAVAYKRDVGALLAALDRGRE